MEIILWEGHQISNSAVQTSITDNLAWMEMLCIWGLWPFLQILWMRKVREILY
jgi:hypothetical protein